MLLKLFSDLAALNRFRYCIVFGGDDCAYIEPNGDITFNTELPNGGIDIIEQEGKKSTLE